MVDTIQHRLDADVRELKRIEDQVKSSIISRVDNGARHIDYLEREVLGLEREVFVH